MTAISNRLSQAFGGGRSGDIMANSLILGGGAFILSAVARALSQSGHSVQEYSGIPLEEHLNTTIDDHVISEDMDYIIKGHKMPKNTSILSILKGKHNKKASLDAVKNVLNGLGDVTESVYNFGKSMFDKDTWDVRNMGNLAIPATAMVISALAGHKLIDNMYDNSDNVALTQEKERLSNLHKKLMMARALNRRGMLSPSGLDRIIKESKPFLIKSASGEWRPPVMDLAGLVLTVAFALGSAAGYEYFSSRNDKRIRYEAIKDGLKQYARDNALMRTIDQRLAPDSVYKELNNIKNTNKTAPTETPVEYMPVTI